MVIYNFLENVWLNLADCFELRVVIFIYNILFDVHHLIQCLIYIRIYLLFGFPWWWITFLFDIIWQLVFEACYELTCTIWLETLQFTRYFDYKINNVVLLQINVSLIVFTSWTCVMVFPLMVFRVIVFFSNLCRPILQYCNIVSESLLKC